MPEKDGADHQDLAHLLLGQVAADLALMVTAQTALRELNLHGGAVTEGELERALTDCGIEVSGAGECLKGEIKEFYAARKDRRLREGYTPSDKAKSGP